MAKSTVKSSDLDFNNIKGRLKTYFQSKSEFNDYDFEASGLSNVLDVLAYNTHINALTANFSLNESFLSTAQLRSSVVSHAQTLGYQIRSRTAARAIVNLSVNMSGVVGRPLQLALVAGTTFTSSIDGTTYTFRTRDTYYARDNGTGLYNFLTTDGSNEIPIFEGTEKTKTFFVGEKDERQIYIIPDQTIDTSTSIVRVYETASSTDFITYTPLSLAIDVGANSTHFQIVESPNGTYELNFGDGTSFGKSPEPGEKVVVTYLSCVGAAANNGTVFSPTADVNVNGVDYTLLCTTATESSGGSAKQSIESIRQLAPIAYAAQKRLVTALDYKGMIESNFPQVRDAAVWSGDQNIPKDYGSVYISLNFNAGTSTSVASAVKSAIVNNYTDNLSVMSMTTKFVDPKDVFLELDSQFNFDPALTGFTIGAIEEQVFKFMATFFQNNLNTFNTPFRRSNLTTEIDSLDKSILSTRIQVRVQMILNVVANETVTETIFFPMKIASPDDIFHRVESQTFEFNGIIGLIKNKLSSTTLQIFDLDGNILLDNVGEYNAQTGAVEIVGFNPSAITGGGNFLKIRVVPENESFISPLRNYIIKLDTTKSSATAIIDRQTPSLEVNI
jgi:hypothetical protein